MIYRVVFYEFKDFQERVDKLILEGYTKSSTEEKDLWYDIYEKKV